ncbi:helix-turn-helix domain-containing protein [Paenibacillus wynnii]|uniref:DNA-binding protein n=1 Tax=Paenibacillus wynnii TaxID=268407 RepID=A0A098MC18_9BACL|nr:helix-turn-helix transcriptional regulator [Paenibacillus wynnii]KGE19571.1 DNA-binding protein [Paenibacillus wynnii]
MEPTSTILAELENYLKRESLTLAQFAERSGLHSGTLSNLLHGHRPIAMHQLDQITKGMGHSEGYYYDMYIDNYIIEGSPDWRRIGPLLHRCAELDKLDSIQRIVQHIMDNLMYSSMLFNTAEELLRLGRRAAATLLYESVSEAEKFQHSERLAVCQYRLFIISLGQCQDANLRLADRFEPFVERLDEAEQLDALKHLADVFSSLHRWDKVNELAQELEKKASAQYKFWKRDHLQKHPVRPYIYYILYSQLLRSLVYDESGNYEKALYYARLYSDMSWIKTPANEGEQRVMEQFKEWAKANTYLYRLMDGQVEVLPDYLHYVESREDEIFPALFKIMQAANRHKFNVDPILLRFDSYLSYKAQHSRLGEFNQQLTSDRYIRFLMELAIYHLAAKKIDIGLNYLLESLESCVKIRSNSNIVRCVGLFEKYLEVARPEYKRTYSNLISEVQRNNEEKDCFIASSR